MKVTVLVPSEEYKNYAGARIRYGRVRSGLEGAGIEIDLQDVADFSPQVCDSDVLLISKCHDARALIAATVFGEKGGLVGVDLFDDYFSDESDSRLTRFRNWLSQLLPLCEFALCSTPRMSEIVQRYRRELPVHVLNDPADSANFAAVAPLAARKLTDIRRTGRAKIAWFGVGDNPHFPVGLSDLAAFGGSLRELASSGLDVELSVLTNSRALNAAGLSLLAGVPVRTQVEVWTERSENELLEDAFAVFLPVNAQPFSAAKSLNRAVTALMAGCQILSVGFPLYAPLDRLIYRDVRDLMQDLASGELKVSTARSADAESILARAACPGREAAALAQFLRSLPSPALRGSDYPLALIHGESTIGSAHKLVQSMQGLSVASPFCSAPLGFDVIFRRRPGKLVMLVSEKAARRLDGEYLGKLGASEQIADRRYFELQDEIHTTPPMKSHAVNGSSLPAHLAAYPTVMMEISARLSSAFGHCRTILSETSPFPFSAAG